MKADNKELMEALSSVMAEGHCSAGVKTLVKYVISSDRKITELTNALDDVCAYASQFTCPSDSKSANCPHNNRESCAECWKKEFFKGSV